MSKNFTEREGFSKFTSGSSPMHKNNQSSSKSTTEMTRRRKDPKSMTTEELEEYINRNRNDSNNKSLNSSFQSQKNNLSFTAGNILNNLNKKNEFDSNSNNITNNELSKNLEGLNYNYSNVNNPFLMNNTHNTNGTNTQNLNVVSSNFQNFKNSSTPYLNTNASNISIDPMSDGEEKYLKFKQKVLPPSFNNPNNSFSNNNLDNSLIGGNKNSNQNSTAANNYLKALQEKVKVLQTENDELKKIFIEVSELLEKERSEFQKKLLNEVNKTTELEKSLKNELISYENENKQLNNEINELQVKISLMNTNMSILENEKGRHLEQNAVDKDNLQNQIDMLIEENEENKERLISVSNENNLLREKLTRVSYKIC